VASSCAPSVPTVSMFSNECAASGNKESEEIVQLQAQLSAAVARVAELEAQAAQDQSLVVEEQPNGSKDMKEITQLQAQLAASHARVAELEAQASQEEHKTSESKGYEEFLQLEAQLSAAHTRVAELEAQSAQDKPVVLEEQPNGSKDMKEITPLAKGAEHVFCILSVVFLTRVMVHSSLSCIASSKIKLFIDLRQLQAQLAASHARVAELEAQASQEEHKTSESKGYEEFLQLEAQLSAAHTRVAELEAQSAQTLEEQPNTSKDMNEITQLQAQLAAAHARVAELEAQAAQDEPLGSEEGSPRATSEELEEIILSLHSQLEAQANQGQPCPFQERNKAVSEDSDDLMQLQTKLSAANTRVAELEAQAAQDNPLALEARVVELEHELHELRSRTNAEPPQEIQPSFDLAKPKGEDGGDDGWDDFNFGDVQVKPSLDLSKPKGEDGGDDGWDDFNFGDVQASSSAPSVPEVSMISTERAASESKESEEIMQLQAKLSAAHTRVAELEAQAAQDQSLVVEEQPSGSKELEEIL
ncbi:unnamed protein product, partial [Durusdinium trenchii]